MKWNMERHQVLLVGVLMLPAIGLGCARSELAAINGRVKFKNGEAIDRGTIEFSPTVPAAANQSGARIASGVYEIPREKGLRAGTYIVRIYSPAFLLSPEGGPGPQGSPAPPGKLPASASKQASKLPEERVSPKFNSESKLVVQVTREAIQTFDFEVEQ